MKRVLPSLHADDTTLQALVWNELDEARAAEVRAHLEGCAQCHEAFEELQEFATVTGPSGDARELEAGHYLAEAVVARARADRWRTAAATALAASLVLATAGAVVWNANRAPRSDEVFAQAPAITLRAGLRATTKFTLASNVELLPLQLIPPSEPGSHLFDLEIRDEAGRLVLVATRLRGRGNHIVAVVPADTLRPGGSFRLTLSRHGDSPDPVSFDIEATSD